MVSLAHLGLLDPSTCVGLRYGPTRNYAQAAFLGCRTTGFASARGPPLPLARPPLPIGGPAVMHRRRLRSRDGLRNVRLTSIGYALRPRLRTRLTLGGRTWPRNPWICGGRDSHPPFRYSCLHGRSRTLHAPSRERFNACATLSYQMYNVQVRGFGCPLESRSFSARSLSASELLRNLQMMAASKPTSWLSMKLHILTIH